MKRLLFLFLIIFTTVSVVNAQDTEFWFGAPDDSYEHGNGGDRPTFLMITTTHLPATVQIYLGSTLRRTVTIPANSFHKENFTSTADMNAVENLITTNTNVNNPGAGRVQNKALRITATAPVSAYYQVDGAVSKDVFTLKGSKALGKHFFTPFQTRYGSRNSGGSNSYNDAYNHFVIVATTDNTNITIQTRGTTTADRPNPSVNASGTQIYRPAGNGGNVNAGVAFNIQLNRGQSYTVRENTRRGTTVNMGGTGMWDARTLATLAGTEVTSDQPIAITVAEPGITVRSAMSNFPATDLLGDQIVPVSELGTHHVIVPGYRNANSEEWVYLTATENGTTVTVNTGSGTTSSPSLNKGQHWAYQLTTNNGLFFTSNKPVYCYHQSAADSETGASLIPSLFSISAKNISFYRQGGMNSNNDVLNTIIFLVYRTGTHGAFRLNGSNMNIPNTNTNVIPGVPDWSFSKVNITVNAANAGLCTIENPNSSFAMGLFSYITTTTTSFGFLSKFGAFSFGSDTIYKCKDDAYPLDAGYNLGQLWTLPDGSQQTGPIIYASQEGLYRLTVDQDYITVRDSVYIINRFKNLSLVGPAVITTGTPQKYYVDLGGEYSENVVFQWTVSGGGSYPVQTSDTVYYTWTDNNPKTIAVNISDSEVGCDTTLYLAVKLDATAALISSPAVTICSNETATLSATATSLSDPKTFRWYSSQTSSTVLGTGSSFTTPILSASTTYYVSVENANYNENAPGNRKEVTVTVTPLSIPSIIKVTKQ